MVAIRTQVSDPGPIGSLVFIMEANAVNPDWVHIVCNIGYLKTEADERADDERCDWQGLPLKCGNQFTEKGKLQAKKLVPYRIMDLFD